MAVFFTNIFPWVTLTGIWTDDSSLLEHTPTSPFSVVFDRAGYHTQTFTLNVGTISYILAFEIFLAMVALALMAFCRCGKCKRIKEWVYGANFISRMFWRTCIQVTFVFLVCVGATFLPARAPFAQYSAELSSFDGRLVGDSLSSAFGHASAALFTAFVLVLVGYALL